MTVQSSTTNLNLTRTLIQLSSAATVWYCLTQVENATSLRLRRRINQSPTCQLFLARRSTHAKNLGTPLFWCSVKPSGWAMSWIILSSTPISSAIIGYMFKTTHSMVTLRCTFRPNQVKYIFLLNRRGQLYIWTLVRRLTKNFTNAYMSRCPPNRLGILMPSHSLSLNGVGRWD